MNAKEIAIALLMLAEEEVVVVGHSGDIQRLYDTGAAKRIWEIALDNGHRPYANQKNRLADVCEHAEIKESKSVLTRRVSRQFAIDFMDNLHAIEHTFLIRTSPVFWSDLHVVFAEDGKDLLKDVRFDYHAVFRGAVSTNGAVRFIRMDEGTLP